MINIWHDIDPSRVTPESFTAVIEIPAGSKKKYELDKQTGLLRLDRILYTSTHYPANYGFIPRTYAGDGDPLDVLVLCSETLDPMVEVDCYPIGVIRMIDDDEIDIVFDEPAPRFAAGGGGENAVRMPAAAVNQVDQHVCAFFGCGYE